MEISEEGLAEFFSTILPLLNERQRRLMGAAMAAGLGRGGQARVAEASGMSRNTVMAGAKELAEGAEPWDRVRRPGAGRKFAEELDPGLIDALESLPGGDSSQLQVRASGAPDLRKRPGTSTTRPWTATGAATSLDRTVARDDRPPVVTAGSLRRHCVQGAPVRAARRRRTSVRTGRCVVEVCDGFNIDFVHGTASVSVEAGFGFGVKASISLEVGGDPSTYYSHFSACIEPVGLDVYIPEGGGAPDISVGVCGGENISFTQGVSV